MRACFICKHRKMATGGAVSDDGLDFWLSMMIVANLLLIINIFVVD